MYLISLSLINQGGTEVSEEGGGAALCSAGWGWVSSIEIHVLELHPQSHTSVPHLYWEKVEGQSVA